MVKHRNQRRDWNERFAGFRINCESVPRLPASVMRNAVDDPRRIPYLLLWRDRWNEKIQEILRVILISENVIELKRSSGVSQRTELRRAGLPNGGAALFLVCPSCYTARRDLYGWSTSSGGVFRSSWQCRICAGLRYSSEGRYVPRMFRCSGGGYPRTQPWDPLVFSNLSDAVKHLRKPGAWQT